ncbi:MAG TPA: hypothetical protein VI260_19485 [Blastocatellia bacterium]
MAQKLAVKKSSDGRRLLNDILVRAVNVSRAREAKPSAMMSPPRGYNNKRVSGREKNLADLVGAERVGNGGDQTLANPKDRRKIVLRETRTCCFLLAAFVF